MGHRKMPFTYCGHFSVSGKWDFSEQQLTLRRCYKDITFKIVKDSEDRNIQHNK